MSNHISLKSKRQQIRELILAETRTEDIVDKVGTTKEYVYNERGKLKQEGLLPTHQSLSISNGQRELTIVKDGLQLEENENLDGPLTARINDYDIPRLDKNSLMLMYEAFEQQKTAAFVTAKTVFIQKYLRKNLNGFRK